MDQTLTTIPGMGPVLAAIILAEIGDVQRFPSADHLVSFCSLALSESQSGQLRQRRFLSHRGSARLRSAFYQAALLAIKYDRYLGAYYRRRVRQGLTKKRAVLSVARKLVRIGYALLKSGQPYQPQVVGGKWLTDSVPVRLGRFLSLGAPPNRSTPLDF